MTGEGQSSRAGPHYQQESIKFVSYRRQSYKSNIQSRGPLEGRGRPLHGTRCGNHCDSMSTEMLDRSLYGSSWAVATF